MSPTLGVTVKCPLFKKDSVELINEIVPSLLLIKFCGTFKYNIPEYMFAFGINKKVGIKKNSNSINTVNTKNYGNDIWEFTKKKVIWARKSDRIKNGYYGLLF